MAYLEHFGKVLSANVVVGLDENLAQRRLSYGIVPKYQSSERSSEIKRSRRAVLGVELVEAMERISVRVYIEHVYRQVVGVDAHLLEHFLHGDRVVVLNEIDLSAGPVQCSYFCA